MSRWREKAIELLPQERQLIQSADSPMALWVELEFKIQEHVEDQDEDWIRGLIEYASWCLSPQAGHRPSDASTAAVVTFFESLPQTKGIAPYLAKYLSLEDFMSCEPHYTYLASEVEVKELKEAYLTERERLRKQERRAKKKSGG